MTSMSSIMHTTISALQAQQVLIDMTSSNINNANTDGYCRRVAVVSEIQNSSSSSYQGAGVEISSIKRVSDAFTLRQLCSANANAGESSTELSYLEDIEAIFDESEGSGLNDALSNFFNAWSSLSNDSSGSTERSVLVSDAQELASTLNDIYNSLQNIRNGIDDDISSTVTDINGYTEQIADLNQKILAGTNIGIDTTSYEDERDKLLTELSSKVKIAYFADDSGQINVQLSNGTSIVSGSNSYNLGTTTNSTTGLLDVTWTDKNGDKKVITDNISGGKLGGELDSRDEVQNYMDDLNTFASELIDQINALHESGYDANGTAGTAFFTGTGAGDIAVNANIVNDSNLIAAASSSDSSSNAAAIAELQDSTVSIDGKDTTFQEYYSSLVSKIGTEVSNTKSTSTTQSDLVTSYENYRESVSGVSTDEELANLTLYQNAYEAAAKVMSVLDEMMKTLLDI
jgi:flagellar hook-associated protein 1